MCVALNAIQYTSELNLNIFCCFSKIPVSIYSFVNKVKSLFISLWAYKLHSLKENVRHRSWIFMNGLSLSIRRSKSSHLVKLPSRWNIWHLLSDKQCPEERGCNFWHMWILKNKSIISMYILPRVFDKISNTLSLWEHKFFPGDCNKQVS